MLAPRLQILTAVLWVGSLWTIGYIVAPVLFATLDDRMLAGTIAGKLFRIEAWVSLVAASVLFALSKRSSGNDVAPLRKGVTGVIGAMLFCTLVGYFGLQPFMASLREAAAATGGMSGALKTQFGLLHGLASVFYLAQSLLGIVLILRIR